jgi:hypothetical protein
MKKIGIKVLTLLGFAQMVTINSLANILPINGMTTGDLSDQLKNLFTPQGATFAIWGVIYSLLFVFTLRILIRPMEQKTETLSKLFIVNTIFNSAWIFAWHYEFLILSLVLMIGLLINLVQINLLLKTTANWSNKITLQLPFTVYFGWISIATIANVTAGLVGYQWEALGISEELWTLTILVVGILVALSQVFYFKQIAYVLVILWAYYGIYGKHTSASGFDNQYPNIVTVLIIAMSVMLLAGLRLSYFSLKKKAKWSNS